MTEQTATTVTLRDGRQQPIVRIVDEFDTDHQLPAGYPQADPEPPAGVVVVGHLRRAPQRVTIMDEAGEPTGDESTIIVTQLYAEKPRADGEPGLVYIGQSVPDGMTNEAEAIAGTEADLVQYLVDNEAIL